MILWFYPVNPCWIFFMPPEDFASHRLSFKTGDTIDLEKLISELVKMGYEREE